MRFNTPALLRGRSVLLALALFTGFARAQESTWSYDANAHAFFVTGTVTFDSNYTPGGAMEFYGNELFLGKDNATDFNTIPGQFTLTLTGGFFLFNGYGQHTYPDGHKYENVHVFGNHILNVDSYAQMFNVTFHDSGTLNMTDGKVELTVGMKGTSVANISGGWVRKMFSVNSATTNISHGFVSLPSIYENSVLNITGGAMSRIEAYDNSTVNARDFAATEISANGSSNVTLTNCAIGGEIAASDYSKVVVNSGTCYLLNVYGNGEITSRVSLPDGVYSTHSSTVNILDGNVAFHSMQESSKLNLSGGKIGGKIGDMVWGIVNVHTGTANITGGTVSGYIYILSNGAVNLYGGDLSECTIYRRSSGGTVNFFGLKVSFTNPQAGSETGYEPPVPGVYYDVEWVRADRSVMRTRYFDPNGNVNNPTPAGVTFTMVPDGPEHAVAIASQQDAPGAGSPDGPPQGAKLTRFGLPAVDDNGTVAFVGSWATPDSKGKGLFTSDGCVGVVGGTIPGGGATYRSFTDPLIDHGRVASIVSLAGTPKASASAVLVGAPAPATSQLIARANDEATADGAKFKRFKAVALADDYVCLLAQLIPGSGSEPKTTAASDLGLWVKHGTGPLVLVLREGQAIGERKIRTLVSLASGSASPGQGRGWLRQLTPSSAQVMALASFDDHSQGIIAVDPDNLTNLALLSTSRIANAAGSPDIQDATFASYGLPAANVAGDSAMLASLSPGSGDVAKANARGIFHCAPGSNRYSPVARISQNAGTTGGNFTSFKDLVLDADGTIAFPATIRGPGIKGAATATLWWKRPTQPLTLLAQGGVGALLVGDLPGAQWKGFTSLAIIPSRGPIFSATLVPGKGGVKKSGSTGLWATDFEGQPRLLFRTGVANAVIPDKTLERFAILKASAGSTGSTRSFNNKAEIVWLATFADDSEAIVTTIVP